MPTMNTAVGAYRQVNGVQAAFNVITTAMYLTDYMWPQQALVKNGSCYDYIIVGAGTAGCVVASRLSEDPNVKVLLIEAGKNPPIESVLAGLVLYTETSKEDWNYKIKPNNYTYQCQLNSTGTLFLGKMLGGTSGLSIELYQRGHPQDFDNWARLVKDSSWKWDNVLPLFKKSERLEDESIANSPYRAFHGYDGYFAVSKDPREGTDGFLEAYQELGNDIVLDLTANRTLGYTKSLLNIGKEFKSTSADFLKPAKRRTNLHVLKETLVTQIIFKHKKAIGVKAVTSDSKILILKARKEIIISSGAVKTPQLLMLSGIGPKKHLIKMGVKPFIDLPVGEKLQDHVAIILVFALNMFSRPFCFQDPFNPHLYTAPVFTGSVAIDKGQNYPDYNTINYVITASNRPLTLTFCEYYYRYQFDICQRIYDKSYGKLLQYTLLFIPNPESRGRVTLRSTNPKDSPIIDGGYFNNDEDLENTVRSIKDFVKILKSTYFKMNNATLLNVVCNRCKKKHGDEYWRCYALCMMKPMTHLGGTCAMGSVVDSRFKVYGVKRLRVVDSSIMPKITSGDTVAPTIMIGEKASIVIKEDNKHQK